MAVSVAEMLNISHTQIDDLFAQRPAGDIPQGEANGTAIVAPGTTYSQNIASFINHFAWQGKVFDPQKGVLRNRILPFGLNAIIAKVKKGPDGLNVMDALFLGYSKPPCLGLLRRDKIGPVGEGVYLENVIW